MLSLGQKNPYINKWLVFIYWVYKGLEYFLQSVKGLMYFMVINFTKRISRLLDTIHMKTSNTLKVLICQKRVLFDKL